MIKQFFGVESFYLNKNNSIFVNYIKLVYAQKIIVFVQCPITNIAIQLILVYKYQPVITYVSFDESFDATKLVLCQFDHLFEVLQFL